MDEYEHSSIHYGYFDEDHTNRDTAVENMTRVVADFAEIGPGDRVLHCGCGIGGPATWVAKNRGAETIGININELHLEKARALAERRGVAEQTEFRHDDFTELDTIDDGEIDVVWGLEAICYAKDKREFLEEAARVLGDDGRLVVADGYMTKHDLTSSEEKVMQKWLDGWKVPHLAHIEDFQDDMRDLEFENLRVHCNDEHVKPFSRGTFMASFPRYLYAKLRQLIGKGTKTEVDHIVGCHYQYRALRKGLWTHSIVYGEV